MFIEILRDIPYKKRFYASGIIKQWALLMITDILKAGLMECVVDQDMVWRLGRSFCSSLCSCLRKLACGEDMVFCIRSIV